MLARYLARRALHALWLLIGVSALSFLFVDLAPGDYFDESRLDPRISPQTIAALRDQYGLTRPLPVRYVRWLESAWHGDFGRSLAYNLPASRLLLPRAFNTLLLTVAALLAAWAIGIPLSVWSAVRPGRWPDRVTALAVSLLLSVPELLLACAAVFAAVRTGALPAGGMHSPGFEQLGLVARVRDLVRHMILPVSVLAAGSLPVVMRHARAAVAEAAQAGFVQAARAHGIPRRRLIWRHILPAAANPLVSLLGLSVGGLLSASLLVEAIVGWPGLGPLFLDAVAARDVPLIVGPVLFSACFLILGSLLSDLLLYALDPRIRVPS